MALYQRFFLSSFALRHAGSCVLLSGQMEADLGNLDPAKATLTEL